MTPRPNLPQASKLRRAWAPALLAALALPLSGCALGALISPATPLERALNGTYEGVGTGLTGRVPYRLILSVQEKGGTVSGVLTNLESRKAYALSGRFRREVAPGRAPGLGGGISARLFEGGDKERGELSAQLGGGELRGTLRTVLLGQPLLRYELALRRVEPVAPNP